MAYGCNEERYPLPIQAVDTHRPKPKKGVLTAAAEAETPRAVDGVKRDYFGDKGAKVAMVLEEAKELAEQSAEANKSAKASESVE